jgi:O-antigen/teichoic acid export membrane protein
MNRRFLKVVGQSSVVRVASAVAFFLLSIVLARSLQPEGYGAYSFAFSIISLATLIAQLGFPVLTVREVAKHIQLRRFRLLRRYLNHSTWMIAAMSVAVLLIVVLGLTFFGRDHVSSWTVILAGVPLALPLPQTAHAAAVLRGTGRVVQSLLGQQLYRPALLLVLVGIGGLAGLPVTAVTVMLLHGVATAVVLIELRLRCASALPTLGQPALAAKARIWTWTSSAVMFSGVAIVNLINTKFDIIAIGSLMTDADVGLYTVAVQISQTLPRC